MQLRCCFLSSLWHGTAAVINTLTGNCSSYKYLGQFQILPDCFDSLCLRLVAFQIWGKLRSIRKKWEIGRSWYSNLLFVVLSACQQCNLVNNSFNIPSSWKLLAHQRFDFCQSTVTAPCFPYLNLLHRSSTGWSTVVYPTHVSWFRFVHLVNLDLFPHKIGRKSTPLSRLWEIHKLTLTPVNVVVGYWKSILNGAQPAQGKEQKNEFEKEIGKMS